MFMRGLLAAVTELLILARDVSITFFTVVVIDFLLYCVIRRFVAFFRLAKFILLSVSCCMFASDLFTLYNFGLPLNTLMLEMIVMSNPTESIEFLQAYLSDPNIWLFFGIIAMVLTALRYVFGAIYRHKKLLYVLALIGLILGIFATGRECLYVWYEKRPLRAFGLSRLCFMLNTVHEGNKAYQRMLASSPQDVHITKNNGNIPYVVFILGESTSRNRMSAYGYELRTTPFLDEAVRNGMAYVFSDVISPHGITSLSLQKMFTFCNYEAPRRWFEYTSLFRIITEAGYRTAWLSNQESSSSWKVSGFYIKDCTTHAFTDRLNESHKRGALYDERLLPIIDDAMRSDTKKNFYLIHLLGTHHHYHKRYPENFETFSLEDEGGYDGISALQRNVRAKYDNAVLYNDFVVNEIVKRFLDKDAVVIYVSDHGEEVYDTMNYSGHNEGLISRFVLEIPMIIWLSDSFRESYPEPVQRIAGSVDRPYMTDDIIHTVLDIMSIETEEFASARSIISPEFDSSRPRVYAGQVYDKETGFHELR